MRERRYEAALGALCVLTNLELTVRRTAYAASYDETGLYGVGALLLLVGGSAALLVVAGTTAAVMVHQRADRR